MYVTRQLCFHALLTLGLTFALYPGMHAIAQSPAKGTRVTLHGKVIAVSVTEVKFLTDSDSQAPSQTIILELRGTGVFDTSVGGGRRLIEQMDLHPEDQISADGEYDPATMVTYTVIRLPKLRGQIKASVAAASSPIPAPAFGPPAKAHVSGKIV